MCEKCYRKSCKYMRNKSIRQKGKKKKLQLHNIKVSSTTVWRYMTSKGWKALKRKRRRTCRHGVRRIWKLYSKGRPASKLTWCEPSGDHLDYRWRENIQRTSHQIAGRAKAVTTLRLEKCVCRHTLGARTFCGVYGQRPIHFEHAHLCAIPKCSPFESKTWQWRRRKI